MLRDFREFLQWRRGDAIILAEANVLPEANVHYFGDDGDRMHMMFNFQVNQNLFYALASGDYGRWSRRSSTTRRGPPTAQWGMFLRNHDELDLGRLSEKQRAEGVRGIRAGQGHAALRPRHPPPPRADAERRPAPARARLQPDVHACRAPRSSATATRSAWATISSLPERNCARTPMQWSTEPHGGFTSARKAVLPVICGGAYGYEQVNVAEQRRDPESLLNWTERMIRMRKEVPEIGWGDFSVLEPASPACWPCATTGGARPCSRCTIYATPPWK